MYLLADLNTGYVYSLVPYFGAIISESLIHLEHPVSARIVLHLYDNLVESIPNSKGYHLYVDRYYTSVPLTNELLKMKCYLTGTIRANRKFLPNQIRKPEGKMRDLMRFSSIKDNILALSWQDKRSITMLSSYDTGNMKVISKVSYDGGQLIFKKPEVIINYNKFMGGVDKADQLGYMYCFFAKIIKMVEKSFLLGT